MLRVNQLVGFGAVSAVVRTLGSAITGGTNIGNMTAAGGLAAAFDGTTNQAQGSSARRDSVTNAYCGKTPASAKRVFKSISYGSNNHGYFVLANTTCDLALYGKTGAAPANGTDGTLLGTLSFTDTADESGNPREIVSSDKETLWDHIWLYISERGTSGNVSLAELQIYEAV